MPETSEQARHYDSRVTGRPDYAGDEASSKGAERRERDRTHDRGSERDRAAIQHGIKDLGTAWDMDTVAREEGGAAHAPHQRYPMEPDRPTIPESYNDMIGAYKKLGITIDESHEVYQKLREALDKMAEQMGVASADFRFDVVRSPQENMFIIHSQELDNPHVVVFTGLLTRLAEQFGAIKPGHVLLAEGHEIGHFKEGHYHEKKKEKVAKEQEANQDPMQVEYVGSISLERAEDLLKGKIFHQEQEAMCDEHAIRAMAAIGEPVHEGVEMLELLSIMEEQRKSAQEEAPKRNSKKARVIHSAVRSMTKTHPASPVRVFRAKGLIRELEVERGRLFSHGRKKSTHLVSAVDPMLQPTPTQEALDRLARIVEPLKQKTDFPWERIGPIVDEANTREELKHLLLLLPAISKTHNSICPFVPFGRVGGESPDKEVGEGALLGVEPVAHALKKYHELTDKERERIKAEGGENERDLLLSLEFERWLVTHKMYPGLSGDSSFATEVLPQLQRDPVRAAELIAEHGKVHFDLTTSPVEWIRDLLDSGYRAVQERGEAFAALRQRSFVDIRAGLLEELLQEGLLDSHDDPAVVLAFTARCRELFRRESGEWIDSELPLAIGSNIALWAEIQKLEVEQNGKPYSLEQLVKDMRSQDPLADSDQTACDPIIVEVASRVLHPSSGASFEGRMDWVESNFEKGKQRDMLLFRLLEEETGFFRESNVQAALEEQYVKVFERVVPLLDLGWFRPTLKKTDVGEASPEEFPFLSTPESKTNYSPLLAQLAISDCYWLQAPFRRDENTARFYVRAYMDALHDSPKFYRKSEYGYELTDASYFNHIAKIGLMALSVDSKFNTDTLQRALAEDFEGLVAHLQAESRPGEPSLLERAVLLHAFGTKYYQGTPASLTKVTENLPDGEMKDFVILRGLAAYLQRIEVAKAAVAVCDNIIATEEALNAAFAPEEDQDGGSPRFLSLIGYEEERIKNLKRYLGKMEALYDRLLARTSEDVDPEDVDPELLRAYESASEVHETRELFQQQLVEMEEHAGQLEQYEQIRELFRRLDSPKTAHGGGSSVAKLLRLEQLEKVYTDYQLYSRMELEVDEALFSTPDYRLTVADIHAIKILVGDAAFAFYHGGEKKKDFDVLTIREKLELLDEFYPIASSEKDRHLIDIFDEDLKDGLTDADALRVYDAFFSELYKVDAGRKIYDAHIAARPELKEDFDEHLSLILSTHPKGSVSREAALRNFFDGGNEDGGAVRTFSQHDEVKRLLELEKGDALDPKNIAHAAATTLLEDALSSSWVGARDKVDTILWLASLKEKPHLVRCMELVQGVDSKEFKGIEDRLSDQQKLKIVRTVLAGPGGVLTDTAPEAKKHFLDALFASVFAKDSVSEENQRSFKAIYDSMMHFVSPERASDILGNFLIAHLQEKEPTFNDQVKIFFESFGFVGAKTAQYLVRNTSTLSPELREILMDLTSRVEGKDKRVVFDAARLSYGEDADRVIYDIGEKVGGGSLMVFYKVRLWNKDHTGPDERGEGVIGVLRPDIVCALPEDLQLIQRVVESMNARPELFGDKRVSQDLVHSLIAQSIEETDLRRLVSVQKSMAKDVKDFMKQHPEYGVHMSVPQIWDKHVITDEAGEEKKVNLCKGSVVMMEHAEGLTLDLFMKKCAGEGEIGEEKITRVREAVADLFLEQLTYYGRVHADLHPGNIIVGEEDGELTINIIDVGLSAKLGKASKEAVKKLMRIGIGSSKVAEDEGLVGRFKEGLLKKVIGLGPVGEKEGKRWITSALNVFESLVGEDWSEAKKENATEEFWKILESRDEKFQQKLTAIVEVAQDLDLYLPQEFYYVLRGIDTLSYVWEEVDWKKKAQAMKEMLRDDERPEIPEIDADVILPRLEEIADRLDIEIDFDRVEEAIDASNEENGLIQRWTKLREGIVEAVQIEGDASALIDEVENLLINDEALRDEYGLTDIAEKLSYFFAQAKKEREKRTHPMFRVEPMEEWELSHAADEDKYGYQARVWKTFLHSGTLLRLRPQDGSPRKALVVGAINPFHFENIEYTPLVPVEEPLKFFVFRDITVLQKQSEESAVEDAKVEQEVDELKIHAGSLAYAAKMLEAGEISQAAFDQFCMRVFSEDDREHDGRGEDWVYNMLFGAEDYTSSTERVKMKAILEGTEPFTAGRTLIRALAKRDHVFPAFFQWMFQDERHHEETNLGALIGEHGLDSIDVAVDGEWRPLRESMITEGESESEYLRQVTLAREELTI